MLYPNVFRLPKVAGLFTPNTEEIPAHRRSLRPNISIRHRSPSLRTPAAWFVPDDIPGGRESPVLGRATVTVHAFRAIRCSVMRNSGLQKRGMNLPGASVTHTVTDSGEGAYDNGGGTEYEAKPLPALGTAQALYPFDAQREGSIPMEEKEEFEVVELDQGDGWTRVRKSNMEEGFVATSYIECFLYNNC